MAYNKAIKYVPATKKRGLHRTAYALLRHPFMAALYATHMKLGADEYNIFSYLLRTNEMSYEQAIKWAYSQYTDEGVDEFIEQIALASDIAEILDLVSRKYQVYGNPSAEFLAGQVASKYKQGTYSLYAAISKVLFDLDLELPKREMQELYIAEDYFGWHEAPEVKARDHALPILEGYLPGYRSSVAKFSV